jgi:hypothetical protein
MKLASLHDLNFESISRDAARLFGMRGAATSNAPRRDTAVFQIVDDSFSEAVNFRFRLRGVTHRGLVTYDALRHGCEPHEPNEPALALFIRHARRMGAAAARKLRRDDKEPVVLETGDL